MVILGQEIISYDDAASHREWLVTNGIGGYASGTVSGQLTRRYHGLLVAALNPPLGRTLLLSKFDETITYHDKTYPLFTNSWIGQPPVTRPEGFRHLIQFHLEGTIPVWRYALADGLIEKRIWMAHDANTTYIRYDMVRGTTPMEMSIKAIVNYRDHHGNTLARDFTPKFETEFDGISLVAFDRATRLYLLSQDAKAEQEYEWYKGYHLSIEDRRGLNAEENALYAAEFKADLCPGKSVTIAASTSPDPNLNSNQALKARHKYEQELIIKSKLYDEPAWIQQLVLAADQCIVRRAVQGNPEGRTILAGYPWFSDWGRDTMISLPGLALSTNRLEDARMILQTYARFVDRGMLPNRFPDEGETPEYNTVDANLWYFQAIRAYHRASGDDDLLRDLFQPLKEIIEWHQKGTRYGIQVDPEDGLIHSGEPGVQLTWMDVKIDDWVVTPRTGKAVEINALWYNALTSMAEFADILDEPAGPYYIAAAKVRDHFNKFWNDTSGYCYDVIDTPDGERDPTLRPNQLIAIALPDNPLTTAQSKSVVDICGQHLLCPTGLRSLSPDHPNYKGTYVGGIMARDSAYHQGTVWGWLIGPFVAAHYQVYGDRELARSFLHNFAHHLHDHGLGTISEIFEGDPPHSPRGCFAQAWSVAEVLRAWVLTRKTNKNDKNDTGT